MKTVKLIALDLDGTLVRTDQRISQTDRDAVMKAKEAGVEVVIATGRIYSTMKKWWDALELDSPMICCNGADIRDKKGSLYTATIDPGQLRKAYELMDAFMVRRYVFCGTKIYCTKSGINKALFEKWGFSGGDNGIVVLCEDVEEILQKVGPNASKFLAWTEDTSEHAAIWDAVSSLDYFSVVNGEPLNFEFTPMGVTKGKALKKLASIMGIGIEHTLAIGDSLNDRDMLQAAGVGVAMGNAMREVIEAADDVTLSIDQCGVAHAINKYIFGEKN